MAKSRTSKKRNPKILKKATQLAGIQVAEELTVAYVDWWMQQEIKRLISSNTLVILPAPGGDTYQISTSTITKRKECWEVTSSRNDKIKIFSSRESAVFYCLFDYKKLYVRAQEISIYDSHVLNLETDRRFLKHKYMQAREKGQGFEMDLYEARLSDVVPKLEHAKDYLQKLLNSAKYIKLWDTNNHETIRNRKQGDSQEN